MTGSFLYSVTTTSFRIVNPNMDEIYYSSVVNGHGYFAFSANINGQYILYVPSIMQSFTLDYTYNVSTPILGLDLTTFVGLVITIGMILELIVLLSNRFLHSTEPFDARNVPLGVILFFGRLSPVLNDCS